MSHLYLAAQVRHMHGTGEGVILQVRLKVCPDLYESN